MRAARRLQRRAGPKKRTQRNVKTTSKHIKAHAVARHTPRRSRGRDSAAGVGRRKRVWGAGGGGSGGGFGGGRAGEAGGAAPRCRRARGSRTRERRLRARNSQKKSAALARARKAAANCSWGPLFESYLWGMKSFFSPRPLPLLAFVGADGEALKRARRDAYGHGGHGSGHAVGYEREHGRRVWVGGAGGCRMGAGVSAHGVPGSYRR